MTADIAAAHRKQQGAQFPNAEKHRGHVMHPHDHVFFTRHGRTPVLKPCTCTWFCMNCAQFFDGPGCYVLRNDSGWPVAVMPGIGGTE